MSTATGRVGAREILAFTIGELGIHVPFMSVVLFLMFFYTEAAGIPAGTAGLIFMIASIWDAITDIPMGYLTDRTRTRWGKCRPYFLFGAIPLAISYPFVFYVPPLTGTALVVFLLVTHIIFRTCFTAVGIPYAAYSARITSDSKTRTTISGFKLFFTIGAGALAAYFMLPLAHRLGGGSLANGFFWAATIFAVAPLIFLPIVFLGTHEAPSSAEPGPRPTAADYLSFFRSNRAFWIVLICIACVMTMQATLSSASLYYFKYYIKDEAAAPLSMTLAMVIGLVVTPAWVVLERYIGKRNAWFAGSAFGLIVLLYFAATTVTSSTLYIAIILLLNVSLYGLTVTMWSMLPDTVEYGHLRSGVKVESLCFGLALFVLKVAMGVGVAAFGYAMDAVGFEAGKEQPAAVLSGMKAIIVGCPILLMTLAAIAVFFYPMRKGDHEKIVATLKTHPPEKPIHPTKEVGHAIPGRAL